MKFLQCLSTCLVAGFAAQTVAAPASNMQRLQVRQNSEPLQDIVTWDQHSLFVNGERLMFYSGEVHPFRIPVPGLWLDIFQKIRSMGYTGVSFYVDWALLEGTRGEFRVEGVFALEPFFEAAQQAGIYLLARPGPYINAEVSGGGFPAWLQRVPGRGRTLDPSFIEATELYARRVGEIIAAAQITNGGPVIAFQPENELYSCLDSYEEPCPNPEYMQYVEDQFRDAGIVVPYIVNDNQEGNFAPGTPAGVDIYGIDSYPLLFDCANPTQWPEDALDPLLTASHLSNSPLTPFSFIEFQGGAFDPWGGWGFEQCYELVGYEFERVFFKNNLASSIGIFSIYMTYGGSNWGNLGHPGGYSSYDYAAVIREDRRVDREKYSEAKLVANFVQASPSYLTTTPFFPTTYEFSNRNLSVTPMYGNGSDTNYYYVRHDNYSDNYNVDYQFTVPLSKGVITLPQLGGELSLPGRDARILVTDYDVGGVNMVYSTADIFTWKQYGDRTVLVVYGGSDETHEIAFDAEGEVNVLEGEITETKMMNGSTVIKFQTGPERAVAMLGGLTVYMLDRNSAYNYWTLKVPDDEGLYGPNLLSNVVIAQAGYLLRNVTIGGGAMNLVGDFNSSTHIEIIGGAPHELSTLNVNGQETEFEQDEYGVVTADVEFNPPDFGLPSLADLDWRYVDSLPEIMPGYDDSEWTDADLTYTNNTEWNLTTPVSLISTDYGYSHGQLLYRGHFVAAGNETSLYLRTRGGYAFGSSAWINSSYLGAWDGMDYARDGNNTYTLPSLQAGEHYVITVIVDSMGINGNYVVDMNEMKYPRGILSFNLAGHAQTDVTWKLTGNLGGESYPDKVRGPLNEGGLYAERMGYHLPGAPLDDWEPSGGPTDGLDAAGVGWFAAEMDLDLPQGWDVPLSFTFTNGTAPGSSGSAGANATAGMQATAYRCQLYVNGWQFGEFVHNIGPQKSYPVPEGILDYHGTNYIAFSLWNLEEGRVAVDGLELTANGTILSGYGAVPMSPMDYSFSDRKGGY